MNDDYYSLVRFTATLKVQGNSSSWLGYVGGIL